MSKRESLPIQDVIDDFTFAPAGGDIDRMGYSEAETLEMQILFYEAVKRHLDAGWKIEDLQKQQHILVHCINVKWHEDKYVFPRVVAEWTSRSNNNARGLTFNPAVLPACDGTIISRYDDGFVEQAMLLEKGLKNFPFV